MRVALDARTLHQGPKPVVWVLPLSERRGVCATIPKLGTGIDLSMTSWNTGVCCSIPRFGAGVCLSVPRVGTEVCVWETITTRGRVDGAVRALHAPLDGGPG